MKSNQVNFQNLWPRSWDKDYPIQAKTKTKTNHKSKSSFIQISRERAEENQLIKGLKKIEIKILRIKSNKKMMDEIKNKKIKKIIKKTKQ